MKTTLYAMCCLAFFSSPSYGEIYKWVDENGRQQFSNIRPATKAADDIQKIQVREGSFVEQDKAQQERTKEFLDSQQARRNGEKHARQANQARQTAYERSIALENRAAEAEQARLRDARNQIRNSPHSAPRAREARRAWPGY